MIRAAALIIIIALRIFYQPGVQANIIPFAGQSSLSTAAILNSSAKLISFTGICKNDKVFLEWTVEENEAACQFEVERSTDGKKYSLTALVFGTDKSEAGKYQFYEKKGRQKTMYRLKLIHKNKKAEYSPVVEIIPNA